MLTKTKIRKHFQVIRRIIKERNGSLEFSINKNLIHFLSGINHKIILGIYSPIGDELNIEYFVNNISSDTDIIFALPKIVSNTKMHFRMWNHDTKLSLNQYKILEPQNTQILYPNTVVVPAVTCDMHGNRIGYGKGYYDRYLENNKNVMKISPIYEEQLYKGILPYDKHDQKIDFIITETRVIKTN